MTPPISLSDNTARVAPLGNELEGIAWWFCRLRVLNVFSPFSSTKTNPEIPLIHDNGSHAFIVTFIWHEPRNLSKPVAKASARICIGPLYSSSQDADIWNCGDAIVTSPCGRKKRTLPTDLSVVTLIRVLCVSSWTKIAPSSRVRFSTEAWSTRVKPDMKWPHQGNSASSMSSGVSGVSLDSEGSAKDSAWTSM